METIDSESLIEEKNEEEELIDAKAKKKVLLSAKDMESSKFQIVYNANLIDVAKWFT